MLRSPSAKAEVRASPVKVVAKTWQRESWYHIQARPWAVDMMEWVTTRLVGQRRSLPASRDGGCLCDQRSYRALVNNLYGTMTNPTVHCFNDRCELHVRKGFTHIVDYVFPGHVAPPGWIAERLPADLDSCSANCACWAACCCLASSARICANWSGLLIILGSLFIRAEYLSIA